MKTPPSLQLAGILSMTLVMSNAWAFNSASTGVDGALDVPSNTTKVVPLPASGILNYTTVHVGANATLRFGKNADNTPVVILSSGDVTIDGGGVVDLNGATAANTGNNDSNRADDGQPGTGGPGGYAGGYGGWPDPDATKRRGGDGLGPGGGKGSLTANQPGGGGFGATGGGGTLAGPIYGVATLVPLLGGSGGAGARAYSTTVAGSGGGGGGGAILVASSGKITVNGQIRANGGNGGYMYYNVTGLSIGAGSGGSGGAVHLMGTEITGTGTVQANGGAGGITYGQITYNGAPGGVGRILFEADTFTALPTVSPILGAAVTVPSNMVVTAFPSVRIASVQNVDAPPVPNGVTDIRLPYGTPNPVAVKVVTQGVPAGMKVVLTAVPRYGDSKVVLSDPIAPDASGRAEVLVNIGIDANQNTLFAVTSN